MGRNRAKKAKAALKHIGQYQHSMMRLKLNGEPKNGPRIENEASSWF